MPRQGQDKGTTALQRTPAASVTAPADPFAILDEIGEAFKDVPPEEIEREVARAILRFRVVP